MPCSHHSRRADPQLAAEALVGPHPVGRVDKFQLSQEVWAPHVGVLGRRLHELEKGYLEDATGSEVCDAVAHRTREVQTRLRPPPYLRFQDFSQHLGC